MRCRLLAAVLSVSICATVPAQQNAAGHRREVYDANAAEHRREVYDANAAEHRREVYDANPPERVGQFAALPNWTGMWETELSAQLNSGELDKAMTEAVQHPERITTVLAPKGVLHPAETEFFGRMQLLREPPYNPEWRRRYERLMQEVRTTPASAVKVASVMACTWEFPLVMENPTDGVFQVLVTPEETLLLFADGEARHIYTDRPHPKPADLWPSDLGNSIGRWDHDTLVIDTIDRKAGALIRIPHFLSPDLSGQAHFTERLRMMGPDALQDEMTIEDPLRLTGPWQVTLRFRRVKDMDRLIPTDCTENDRYRVVKGKMTITPP
jgi:hypothetical protein